MAITFGVSQNKVFWRLLNLASPCLCSVQSTSITYVGATNISEYTQFAKFAKYNSTPKFVDLQYLGDKQTEQNRKSTKFNSRRELSSLRATLSLFHYHFIVVARHSGNKIINISVSTDLRN